MVDIWHYRNCSSTSMTLMNWLTKILDCVFQNIVCILTLHENVTILTVDLYTAKQLYSIVGDCIHFIYWLYSIWQQYNNLVYYTCIVILWTMSKFSFGIQSFHCNELTEIHWHLMTVLNLYHYGILVYNSLYIIMYYVLSLCYYYIYNVRRAIFYIHVPNINWLTVPYKVTVIIIHYIGSICILVFITV